MDQPAPTGWSVCPGCGLELPGTEAAGSVDPRRNASAACWQLYGEVTGYELQHVIRLGRYHQLTVDAYAAQHAGDAGPAIGVAFALIGLHLALEEGLSGNEVRDAHQALAGRFRDWPRFAAPSALPTMTVFDVASAGSPDEHAERVLYWARSEWERWQPAHDAVARLIAERSLREVRPGRTSARH